MIWLIDTAKAINERLSVWESQIETYSATDNKEVNLKRFFRAKL